MNDLLRTGGEEEDLIMVNLLTMEEVCRDISRLKFGKKGGDDGLTNEHPKLGG